ncbi:phosphodiesterase/alkaline phosphatase D-like protein [Ornithinimicrobium humiphilum]|uniref:Phosphodiesterase/alkaline phosphatase D-like protein n=1 Tax=Ornithinimicrobium humiphilum TaxID=125288 RepID=A0A543KKA0_9MICO|nr:phosphodiesterase/alkaline phosphatase D-like protein [Ornithinimicrobium humiphilum]
MLGPLLRHVDATSAAVWVETGRAGKVAVRLIEQPDRVWRARTFAVHGHHYALVEVDGLDPGTRTAYQVLVDGEVVWPPAGTDLPASTLTTLPEDGAVRLAFGSCRTSVPHDAVHHLSHGVDALRSYALALADGDPGPLGTPPQLLLLLGDQVYADSTSAAMREFIAARRDLDEEPGPELADYEEYAHLYRLAWSEPALRWLLSWLPSLMIFDDHDVRDDWNTSQQWREEMEATSWWHGRIVAGLGSYWVYQHLGNLSPAARAEDPLWVELRRRQEGAGEAEVDLTDAVDAFAERTDAEPLSYRWSYTHRLGRNRLVVVDSRASRRLDPGDRAMLDERETRWVDEQLVGDVDHLLVGTSLPFLLPRGLHHLESWNEALVNGGWGHRLTGVGERLRQELDLEHWGAFAASFDRVAEMVDEVADGRRGAAPSSVLFLSGDVHHSYVTEVERRTGSRILQLVCSPIRNPLPRAARAIVAGLSHGARPLGTLLARSARVPDPRWDWHGVAGPWFDNNLALLELDGTDLRAAWVGGKVLGGEHDRPRLAVVADLELDVPPVGSEHHDAVARVHPGVVGGMRGRLRRLRERLVARRSLR